MRKQSQQQQTMANRNTKQKNKLQAKEFHQRRMGGQEISPPERKTKPKNIALYKKFPGYRKDTKQAGQRTNNTPAQVLSLVEV